MRGSQVPVLLYKKPAGGVGTGAILFDELWPGIAGAALPAAWVAQSGSPVQDGTGGAHFTTAGSTVRQTNATDYVITAIVGPDIRYPSIIFRADSTGTNYNIVVFHAALGKLRYYEHVSSVDSNITDGVNAFTQNIAVQHTVEITVIGGNTTVRMKIGAGAWATEITPPTTAQNLTNTYVGPNQAVAPAAGSEARFGEIKVQA